jgi:hypothetical protein
MKALTIIVWLFYGLGGAWMSPGIDQIAAKLRAIPGVTVRGPYHWDQWRAVVPAIKAAPAGVLKATAGYSCGNQGATGAAVSSGVPIAMVAGIQASLFCPPVPLSRNIAAAQETYNADCWATIGLGCAAFNAAPGFPASRLTFIQRPDSHGYADLDPDAQNDVIRAVKAVMTAKPKARRREGNVPRLIIRHRGE